MKNPTELLQDALDDADLSIQDIPKIDLYMDQILTLLEEGLKKNKRTKEDKLITKTMINNYSKQHIIMPIKGKKYSREQVMQLLCVLNLKQTLSLSDIGCLTEKKENTICYEDAYVDGLRIKTNLRERMRSMLQEVFEEQPNSLSENSEQDELALLLALSSVSIWMRRICEQIIDANK